MGRLLTLLRQKGADFAPTDLAGLALWLDASDTSTITHSSGAVSQWDDKSGNGQHVTQGTASLQPATGVETLNGLNVLTRSGADWRMSRGAFVIPQPFTVMFVGSSPSTGAQWPWSGTGGYSAGSSTTWFTNMGADQASLDVPWGDGAPFALAHVINGDASVTRFRGAQVGAGSPGAGGLATLDIMNRASGGRIWLGKFAELVMWSRALTAPEIAQAEAYAAAKWGVTLA